MAHKFVFLLCLILSLLSLDCQNNIVFAQGILPNQQGTDGKFVSPLNKNQDKQSVASGKNTPTQANPSPTGSNNDSPSKQKKQPSTPKTTQQNKFKLKDSDKIATGPNNDSPAQINQTTPTNNATEQSVLTLNDSEDTINEDTDTNLPSTKSSKTETTKQQTTTSNNTAIDSFKNERYYQLKYNNITMTFLFVPEGKYNEESPSYHIGMTEQQYDQWTQETGTPCMWTNRGMSTIGLSEGFFMLDDEVTIEEYDELMGTTQNKNTSNENNVQLEDAKDVTTESNVQSQNTTEAQTVSEPNKQSLIDNQDDEDSTMDSDVTTEEHIFNPKVGIRWYDAMGFCAELQKVIKSDLKKKKIKNVDVIVRLPSEIEWECAARGKDFDSLYPWGDSLEDLDEEEQNNIETINKWMDKNDFRSVENSEHRTPSLVFKHLCSSASEWCLDEYSSSVIKAIPNCKTILKIEYAPYFEQHQCQPGYIIRYEDENGISAQQVEIIKYKEDFVIKRQKNRSYRGGNKNDKLSERMIANRRGTFSDMPTENLGFRPVVIFRVMDNNK